MTPARPLFPRALAGALLLAALPLARGGEAAAFADGIQVGGFGTASVSCYSQRNADYVYNFVPEGPGRTRACDPALDSLLGLQADAAVTEQVKAAVQVVGMRRSNKSLEPQITMLNLRWQVDESTSVRVGRYNLPLFLEAEYRLVRFSLPAVRPPEAVYGLVSNFTVDGVDILHVRDIDGWRVSLYGGVNRATVPVYESNNDTIDYLDTNRQFTTILDAERGPWKGKLGYSRYYSTFMPAFLDNLLAGLRSIDPAFPGAAALAGDLQLRETPTDLYSASLRFDGPQLLVEAEIARNIVHGSFYRSAQGADLLVGYRVGDWMPYALAEKRSTWGSLTDAHAGPLVVPVDALLEFTRFDARSFIAGVSREITPHLTLKGELQWVRPEPGARGYFLTNQTADYDYAHPPWEHLVTLGVSFAF